MNPRSAGPHAALGLFDNEEDVNLHIGRRLRRRRMLLGLTQCSLAATTGLTFQQIQKYECGGTRITAARLCSLATALHAPVEYFISGRPDHDQTPANDRAPAPDIDLLDSREAHDLLAAYFKLPEQARRRLFDLIRTLNESPARSD